MLLLLPGTGAIVRRLFTLNQRRYFFTGSSVCLRPPAAALILKRSDWTRSNDRRVVVRTASGSASQPPGGAGSRMSVKWLASAVALFGGGLLAYYVYHQWLPIGMSHDDNITLTVKKAILAKVRGDFLRAEMLLHNALILANHTMNEDAITHIYDQMANLSYERGHWKESENLFKETIQRIIGVKKLPINDNAVLEISIKLADCQSKLKRHDNAETGYNWVIDQCQMRLDASRGEEEASSADVDLELLKGMALHQYGKLLHERGLPQPAVQRLKETLKISQHINGVSHNRNVTILNDLATVLVEQAKFEEALAIYEECLSLARRCESPYVTVILCNKARLLLITGKVDEASALVNECQEVMKVSSPDPELTAMIEQLSADITVNKTKARQTTGV